MKRLNIFEGTAGYGKSVRRNKSKRASKKEKLASFKRNVYRGQRAKAKGKAPYGNPDNNPVYEPDDIEHEKKTLKAMHDKRRVNIYIPKKGGI